MGYQRHQRFQNCPVLGVGLALRAPIFAETLAASDIIQWLEIGPEDFMGVGGISMPMLLEAKSAFPIVSHGTLLSLGSLDPLNENYLDDLKKLFNVCRPAWFSDHLCFSSYQGQYFHDLIPLPRTSETIRHVSDRIKRVQDEFQIPFLVENLTQYLQCAFDTMREAEFYASVLEQADCGLLLDINNVYVNSLNLKSDPMDFLNNLSLDRVVEIHVAGHSASAQFPGIIADTHDHPVCEPVWDLLEWTLERTKPCGVLLERDDHFPPFADLHMELERIRTLWNKTSQPLLEESYANA